jgi:hypothetical protein
VLQFRRHAALSAARRIAPFADFGQAARTGGDARISEHDNSRMGTSMIGNRLCALALSAASALVCFAPPASAATFDGNWSMTAVTTRGHCGTIPIGMGIAGGRIYSTGGSFAFYSISLGGRVSASGSVSLKAVAGPRVAHGTGRFTHVRGSGRWHGKGPSGLCSGVWSATRS